MSDGGTPVTPTTPSNYVLLTRPGQSRNWTEVSTATSIVGDVLTFANITVPSDGYYTLGSLNYVASPLPVGLTAFEGRVTEKGVELSWTTATEWNNERFTIERSSDGGNFDPILVVSASGNSVEKVSYTALDHDPMPGRIYYRLSQTDLDGTTTNLKTIAVQATESFKSIEVIPNPSNGRFWFDLPPRVIDWKPAIINSSGQNVQFNHTASGRRISVDMENLPSGLYVLKLITDRGISSTKFLIE
jgi:hypothetical protein